MSTMKDLNAPITIMEIPCCEECVFLWIGDRKQKYACEVCNHRYLNHKKLQQVPDWCPLLKQHFVVRLHKPNVYEDSIIDDNDSDDDDE